jgi:probable rRNA maturation factor
VIELRNLQRSARLDLSWLRRFATVALAECREKSADGRFALKGFTEISIAIVSDARISRLHRDFMNIPGPTDVITFDHGEVVISAQTAAVHAAEYGHSTEHEVALYVVHGFLHLNGYDDRLKNDRARMEREQKRIMKACLARVSVD